MNSYHTDDWLSKASPPRDAEDMYREYLKRHPAIPSFSILSKKEGLIVFS
jgi:hypothetical protein